MIMLYKPSGRAVFRNADYIIDMGPGGGSEGGRIVATGTPDQIREAKDSATGRFI